MDNVKIDFEKRKEEIDGYLSYLKLFDNDDTYLSFQTEDGECKQSIGTEFQTTLIANSFLLLYNLIESTVRNAVIEIYESIKQDGLTFDELSDSLKKIYTRYEIERFKEGNFRMDTIREFVLDFANKISSGASVEFSKEWMDFSGNLDAKEIRKLAQKIGFLAANDGRNLVQVKEKRNRLAHGEHTFYDIGKDYTVNEIMRIKEEVTTYLNNVIGNIETFIYEKGYKKHHP